MRESNFQNEAELIAAIKNDIKIAEEALEDSKQQIFRSDPFLMPQ